MKQILVSLVISLLLISGTHAGLFEYHMNGTLDSHVKNTVKDADVIESIPGTSSGIPASPKYSYRTSYYHDEVLPFWEYDYTYGNSGRSYYEYIAEKDGFYRYEDLEDMLKDAIRELEDEAEYIDDRKVEIKTQLSHIKGSSSSYYRATKYSLEQEYDFLEDREVEVETLVKDTKKDLKKLQADKNSYSRGHYYHYYDDYGYYNSYYDRNDRRYYRDWYRDYESTPSWLNPDLEEVRDGHIYVR